MGPVTPNVSSMYDEEEVREAPDPVNTRPIGTVKYCNPIPSYYWGDGKSILCRKKTQWQLLRWKTRIVTLVNLDYLGRVWGQHFRLWGYYGVRVNFERLGSIPPIGDM